MTDATMTREIILTEEEKSMTILHLNEEIVCFIKSIFSDIEQLEKSLEIMFQNNEPSYPHDSRNWTEQMWNETWNELLDELKQSGFDGTYHSITYNDIFWDNIITLMNINSNSNSQLSLYDKLLDHQFTVIRQDMVPILMPEYNGRLCLENNLLDYIEENWTTVFKEPIMKLYQMEYDICCK